MKNTLIALALLLPSALTLSQQPSSERYGPIIAENDVSPRQAAQIHECVTKLRYEWPKSEEIKIIRMRKELVLADTYAVFVNMDVKMSQEDYDALMEARVDNNGACYYVQNKLASIFWMNNSAGDRIIKTATAPDFNWAIVK